VTEEENEAFIDLVEDYFGQADETKMDDARPQYGYQIGNDVDLKFSITGEHFLAQANIYLSKGVTPEKTEKARCNTDPTCQRIIAEMLEDKRPLAFKEADPKVARAFDLLIVEGEVAEA
jgi:hypothetical protein